MNTQDMIAQLALEPAAPPLKTGRIALAIVAGVTLFAVLFLAFAGLRADLLGHLVKPLVAAKTLLPALLCVLALSQVMRWLRPGAASGIGLRGLAGLALLGVLPLCLTAMLASPASLWFADLALIKVVECLGFILLISAPALAVAFALVRQGAPTAPARTGAMLGLGVSAGATAGYSFYCMMDNPLFYVIWYGVAILTVTALGALAGARLLRW